MRIPFALALLAACHRPADTDDTDTTDTDTTDTSEAPFPPCEAVDGFVTFSRDGGVTLAPGASPSTNTYTWSIAVAGDAPSVLYAEHGGTIFRSRDAGCTFAPIDVGGDTLLDLHAAGGGEVWGHAENGTAIVHVTGGDGDAPVVERPSPATDAVLGMSVALGRIVVGTSGGTRYERAADGRWNPLGGPPLDAPYAYDWAFDPATPDRAVVGLMRDGVWTTHDGGETWQRALGFDVPTNVFTVVWSPADPDVVWAEGLDIGESDAGAPSQGRHVWRSTDGGLSFAKVVDQGGEITLTNGLPMTPDPVDANVVWFVFGTFYQGEGTWLYRYDHATDEVAVVRHPEWDEFRALAFSPADPSVMYVALVDEDVQ